MKNLFIATILYFLSKIASSQYEPIWVTPERVFDLVLDQHGKSQNISDLQVYRSGGAEELEICSDPQSYFVLHFDENSLLPGTSTQVIERMDVICQVFYDLSQFINSPLEQTGNKVHIRVRDINDVLSGDDPVTSPTLGTASSFYIVPANNTPDFGGIADNAIWQTIHNGIDAYQNVASSLQSLGTNPGDYYHGYIAVNFSHDPDPWHTNLSTSAPASLLDLYTVVLHEAAHALGLHSLLDYDGESIFGSTYQYYSRYDTFLWNNSGSTPVIAPVDNSCSSYMYNFGYNTSVDITPNCTVTGPVDGNSNYHNCTTGLLYSGTVEIPIYTPTCYEPGHSFSHFEDQCFPTENTANDNLIFVMSNSTGAGITKRNLTNEERLVLCDIGYSTNLSYGPIGSQYYKSDYIGACSGISVAGVNDGITNNTFDWVIGPFSTLNITYQQLIANDVNAVSITCPQPVMGGGSVTNDNGTQFTFSSNGNSGFHLLRYIPLDANGIPGNITYVYIFVEYLNCDPNNCFMVTNSDFELATGCGPLTSSLLDCWYALSATPDIFTPAPCTYSTTTQTGFNTYGSDPATNTYSGGGNGNFIGLHGYHHSDQTHTERTQTVLTAPILSGVEYDITFWAKVNNSYLNNGLNIPIIVEFAAADWMLANASPSLPTIDAVSNALILGTATINAATTTDASGDWWFYTIHIPAIPGSFSYNALIISIDSWSMEEDETNSLDFYVFLDDVQVKPHPDPDLSFEMPDYLCGSIGQIENLEQFTTPEGGSFTSYPEGAIAEILDGQETSYNFDPSNTGEYIITYSYQDDNGCITTANEIINFGPECSGDIIITADETWSSEFLFFCGNVIVNPGIKLRILEGSIIQFAANKGIILQDGADLDVWNSTITVADDCGPFWNGISSQRLSNYSNSVDENKIEIKDSFVSFARKVLSLYTIDTANPNTAFRWAYFTINNSDFANNKIDLFLSGPSPNPLVHTQIFGQVSNSTFVVNSDFPSGEIPNQNKNMIRNIGKPISFTNCQFVNEVSTFLTQNWEFCALDYQNAHVRHVNWASNGPGLSSNSCIRGFTRGIRSVGTSSLYLVGVDFANWRNVYSRNSGVHYVKDNDFYNIEQSLMSEVGQNLYVNGNLNYLNLETFDISVAPYGLYFDGAYGKFTVLDNYFNTAIQLSGWNQLFAHGMIANNTGDNSNRIRRNVFTNMQRALKIQGDNRTSNISNGLKYSCNTFSENLSDIRELGSNVGAITSFGVPHQQSLVNSIPSDPNNNFTQNSPNCTICGNDDISNTNISNLANHNYLRLIGSQEPNDIESSDPPKILFINSTNDIDQCISNIQGMVTSSGSDISNSSIKSLCESNFSILHEVYQTVVDGGNTDNLLNEIQDASFSQALQVYYQLMSESPNISDEVLVEALKKCELPNVLLTQILCSNPRAAKSGHVKEEMENRPISFSEYEKEQIELGLTLFSSIELMELTLGAYLGLRGEAIIGLFQEIEQDDSILDKQAAKLSLLDESFEYNDLLMKVDLLSEMQNYSEAHQLISEASDYFRLLPEDKVDLTQLEILLSIKEELQTAPGSILNYSQKNTLENMLYSTSAIVSTAALSVLIEKGEMEYLEPITQDDAEDRNLIVKKSPKFTLLKIFPNPAKNLVIVDYKPAGIHSITVYDSMGKLVLQQNTDPFATQFYLDLSELAASIYEVRMLSMDGKTIESSTLIKE